MKFKTQTKLVIMITFLLLSVTSCKDSSPTLSEDKVKDIMVYMAEIGDEKAEAMYELGVARYKNMVQLYLAYKYDSLSCLDLIVIDSMFSNREYRYLIIDTLEVRHSVELARW